MTSEVALKVGHGRGQAVLQRHSTAHRVVIGKDTRLSGYMIESALMSGFTAVGMDVFLLGPMPTPAVAMLTRSLRADLGVMISASHNPYEDNGIKLFDPDGYKLSDEAEARDRGADGRADRASCWRPPTGSAAPSASRARRSATSSIAKRTLPRNIRLNGLRVVIDCANGAAYQVAPDALWELGAEVIKIGVEPNGHNINHKCGSTSPEALCAKVREMRADIGIALDGDADRVVIVDEKGRIVDGDQIMAVIAESWHRRRQAGGRRRGGDRHVQPGARALPQGHRARRWCARPSATATSSSTCASTATTSAASSRATSCCPTSPPPATAWSPRCRCCPSWSAPASR